MGNNIWSLFLWNQNAIRWYWHDFQHFSTLNCFFNSKWDSTANQIRPCLSIECWTTSNHHFIHIRSQFVDCHTILNMFPFLHCFFNSKWDNNGNQIRRCLSIRWSSASSHHFIHIKRQFLDYHMILNTFSLLHCFFNWKWDSTVYQIRTCLNIQSGTASNHYLIHIKRQFHGFHMILNISTFAQFLQFKVR